MRPLAYVSNRRYGPAAKPFTEVICQRPNVSAFTAAYFYFYLIAPVRKNDVIDLYFSGFSFNFYTFARQFVKRHAISLIAECMGGTCWITPKALQLVFDLRSEIPEASACDTMCRPGRRYLYVRLLDRAR